MLTRFATAAIILGALAGTTLAQPAARGMAACRADTAKFCAGMEAGRGKRVACLAANTDKLSSDCAAVLQQRMAQGPAGSGTQPPSSAAPASTPPTSTLPTGPTEQKPGTPSSEPAANAPPQVRSASGEKGGKGRLAACRQDMKALCTDIPGGGGAKLRCLQENEVKLSPACTDTLTHLNTAKQATRAACNADARSLCPGLKGDERRACFTENLSKLSPECAASVSKRASR